MNGFRITANGYRQVDPLPQPEELKEHYARKYYQDPHGSYQESYDDEERAWLELDPRIAECVFASEGCKEPRTLLDVGCGEGFFMAALAARGWRVLGFDFSSFAMTRFNPQLLPHFVQGSVYELLDGQIERDQAFGLLNLSNVLEHVRDPEGLLRRLRRTVAPGGLLRINVPNDFSALQERLLALGKVDQRYWVAPPEHLNYFSADSLRSLLRSEGWQLARLLSTFPVEHFLLHDGSNYIRHPEAGKQAHRARILLDLHYSRDLPAFVRMREAQAACGMGRSLIAFARPV
jgi:SAM-dependent methyltransferase